MTNGIIQEVFKRHKKNYNKDSLINIRFNWIEQDLIEKIKQELNKPGCNSYCKIHRKRLIGDNQE